MTARPVRHSATVPKGLLSAKGKVQRTLNFSNAGESDVCAKRLRRKHTERKDMFHWPCQENQNSIPRYRNTLVPSRVIDDLRKRARRLIIKRRQAAGGQPIRNILLSPRRWFGCGAQANLSMESDGRTHRMHVYRGRYRRYAISAQPLGNNTSELNIGDKSLTSRHSHHKIKRVLHKSEKT